MTAMVVTVRHLSVARHALRYGWPCVFGRPFYYFLGPHYFLYHEWFSCIAVVALHVMRLSASVSV